LSPTSTGISRWWLIIAGIAGILIGLCQKELQKKEETSPPLVITCTSTIEGCSYIVLFDGHGNAISICHKGNCTNHWPAEAAGNR